MRFQGRLYRAINPVYAREPLSGRGAALYGGRFNRQGTAALYTSLSIMTAIREANQVGSLQPTTLVAYEADIASVFDCRDNSELARFGMSQVDLADPGWRQQMKTAGVARTQLFAEALGQKGYQGLLVQSFARGSTPNDLNLVLWQWTSGPPARLMLIDDDNRLG